jgi:hypothetical protein
MAQARNYKNSQNNGDHNGKKSFTQKESGGKSNKQNFAKIVEGGTNYKKFVEQVEDLKDIEKYAELLKQKFANIDEEESDLSNIIDYVMDIFARDPNIFEKASDNQASHKKSLNKVEEIKKIMSVYAHLIALQKTLAMDSIHKQLNAQGILLLQVIGMAIKSIEAILRSNVKNLQDVAQQQNITLQQSAQAKNMINLIGIDVIINLVNRLNQLLNNNVLKDQATKSSFNAQQIAANKYASDVSIANATKLAKKDVLGEFDDVHQSKNNSYQAKAEVVNYNQIAANITALIQITANVLIAIGQKISNTLQFDGKEGAKEQNHQHNGAYFNNKEQSNQHNGSHVNNNSYKIHNNNIALQQSIQNLNAKTNDGDRDHVCGPNCNHHNMPHGNHSGLEHGHHDHHDHKHQGKINSQGPTQHRRHI